VLSIIPFSVSDITGPISNCALPTGTYSATAVNGSTYAWSVPTGITITSGAGTNSIAVAYGKTFTVAGNISLTVTSTCGTTNNKTIIVTPSAILATAPAKVSPAAICGPGTATVAVATASPSGTVIDWYDALTGGNLVQSGSDSYTKSLVNSNTSYFAEARIVATGCVAKARKEATITVNTVPDAPTTTGATICGTGKTSISAEIATGGTIDWYADATGGTALLATKPVYAIASIGTTTTFYATSRIIKTGCYSASRTATKVTVNTVPKAPTAIPSFVCGGGAITLGATPDNNESISWFDKVKAGAEVGTNTTTITKDFAKTLAYFAEAKSTEGCLSARTSVTGTVVVLPKPIAKVAGATKCGPAVVTLSATAIPGALTDWYATSTGGSALSTADSYTTPSAVDATTNYYVGTRLSSAYGCVSATRTAVPVIINTIPSAPALDLSVCTPKKVTAIAVDGGTIDWYKVATGSAATDLEKAKSPAYVSKVTVNTTFYAEAKSVAGCSSLTRTPAVAKISCAVGREITATADAASKVIAARVYPNPSNGNFTISFQSKAKAATATIQLIGAQGNVLRTVKVPVNSDGSVTTQMSVKGIASGMYQARYMVGNESGNVRVVIVK
jgi:hypothetical protein